MSENIEPSKSTTHEDIARDAVFVQSQAMPESTPIVKGNLLLTK